MLDESKRMLGTYYYIIEVGCRLIIGRVKVNTRVGADRPGLIARVAARQLTPPAEVGPQRRTGNDPSLTSARNAIVSRHRLRSGTINFLTRTTQQRPTTIAVTVDPENANRVQSQTKFMHTSFLVMFF
jgi:hypothetical protein